MIIIIKILKILYIKADNHKKKHERTLLHFGHLTFVNPLSSSRSL